MAMSSEAQETQLYSGTLDFWLLVTTESLKHLLFFFDCPGAGED
jgi:hypothetical protein